jgi:hypothetical protein
MIYPLVSQSRQLAGEPHCSATIATELSRLLRAKQWIVISTRQLQSVHVRVRSARVGRCVGFMNLLILALTVLSLSASNSCNCYSAISSKDDRTCFETSPQGWRVWSDPVGKLVHPQHEPLKCTAATRESIRMCIPSVSMCVYHNTQQNRDDAGDGKGGRVLVYIHVHTRLDEGNM